MNRRSAILVVPALVFFAAAIHAGDPAPAAEPKPAAPAVAPAETKPEAKPEAQPVPAEKPLAGAAAKFQPVVDAYQQAHDSLLAWLHKASAKMDAVDAKIADLKAKAEPKSAQETEQRLTAMRKREPVPPPDPELQTLLADLQAQETRKRELAQALAAAVGQKVQESNKAVTDALDKAMAPAPAPAP